MGHKLLKQLDVLGKTQEAVNALHSFVYPLLSCQPLQGEYSKWEDVLECFNAVYFLEKDGNFAEAHRTTQFFAIWKYLCRGTTFYEAMTQAKEQRENPQRLVFLLYFWWYSSIYEVHLDMEQI